MNDSPVLGMLITDGDKRRDAGHIAFAPVTASCRLNPGQWIGLIDPADTEHVGSAEMCEETIGIVDPFLKADVEKGQRFWLWLAPNTVVGLRHVYRHPAFERAADLARQRIHGEQR
jgi:hypothetical protein